MNKQIKYILAEGEFAKWDVLVNRHCHAKTDIVSHGVSNSSEISIRV